MGINPGELLIHDATPLDVTHGPGLSRGLVPRDPVANAPGYLAGVPAMRAVDFPLIPRSEWSARIKEMEATESRLSDVIRHGDGGKAIPCYYQNGWGYCWSYGTAHAVTALRAAANQPYVRLSPFAVAHVIKGGKDEGGWGAQSLEWVMANGIPSDDVWPNLKAGLSQDTPAMRANAALHKVQAGWFDLESPIWDRDLTFDQMMTLLLCRVPVVIDLNWWGHCVCALDPVEIEGGSFGPRIWNSHGEDWGDRGMGVLQGSRGIPDNAVAPRVAKASAN